VISSSILEQRINNGSATDRGDTTSMGSPQQQSNYAKCSMGRVNTLNAAVKEHRDSI